MARGVGAWRVESRYSSTSYGIKQLCAGRNRIIGKSTGVVGKRDFSILKLWHGVLISWRCCVMCFIVKIENGDRQSQKLWRLWADAPADDNPCDIKCDQTLPRKPGRGENGGGMPALRNEHQYLLIIASSGGVKYRRRNSPPVS